VGLVRGRGASIASPREQTRLWLDIGLGARAQLMVSSRLGVEIGGGLFAPITRDVWVFDSPRVVVHETPPIGGYLTAGLRVVLAGPIY
jgi:hypothetical protein